MLQLMLGELLPVVTLGDPVVATLLLLLLLLKKLGVPPTPLLQVVVGSHGIDSSDFGLVLITPYQVTHLSFVDEGPAGWESRARYLQPGCALLPACHKGYAQW